MNKSVDDILFQKTEFEIYIFTWLLLLFPNFGRSLLLNLQKKKFLLQGESKKSVISGKVVFLCANLLYGIFSIFFGNFIFFRYSKGPKKKSANSFFSISKVHKSKTVLTFYFYQNLKFYKDWITESQKICKIVRRKFASFSLRKSLLVKTRRAIEKTAFP